jgi:transcription elongation GreA/GreB family factor
MERCQVAKIDDSAPFLFVEDDLAALRGRVAGLEKAYKETLSGVHESTTQSSETWHDNPAFDDVQQRSRMYYTEYSKLNAVLSAAKLVSVGDGSSQIVAIGTRVQVILNEKAKDEFVVCSYRCFHDSEEYISYSSPVGAALLGTKPGDKASYRVGDRAIKIEVTGIGG